MTYDLPSVPRAVNVSSWCNIFSILFSYNEKGGALRHCRNAQGVRQERRSDVPAIGAPAEATDAPRDVGSVDFAACGEHSRSSSSSVDPGAPTGGEIMKILRVRGLMAVALLAALAPA